jgi:hypothetical protein
VSSELLPFLIGCGVQASLLLGFGWGLTAAGTPSPGRTARVGWRTLNDGTSSRKLSHS